MIKFAREGCSKAMREQNRYSRLENAGKLTLCFTLVIARIRYFVDMSGYLLAIAVSIGLWFGVYTAFNATVFDDRQDYANKELINQKPEAEESRIYFVDADSA